MNGKSGTNITKDPVCGMTIEKDKAEGTYGYDNKTYHFCAVSCKERFAKEPEKYIKDEKQMLKEHHCC